MSDEELSEIYTFLTGAPVCAIQRSADGAITVTGSPLAVEMCKASIYPDPLTVTGETRRGDQATITLQRSSNHA